MAKFLTTSAATAEIEKIINNTKSTLILICPFIKIPENLFQNLKVADKKKVAIVLVYGKRELDSDERNRLRQLDNLSLYYLENLHAKCFFNEEAMVITSFNMYDSSAQNREMGVLITRNSDPECFNEAREEAQRIVQSATKDGGNCIGCGSPIPLNPDYPFCRVCWDKWKVEKNPQRGEKYCHMCGETASTTINNPLCESCSRKSQRER
jgi:ribosomal protein S14